MIPDIIKFFNGGGIPMFQNSGKVYGWDNPEAHSSPILSERRGVTRQDLSAIQTDENGLQYRDIRTNEWEPGSGDKNYFTSIERVYNPNQKGYKKAVKKGLIPYMSSGERTEWGTTGNRDTYGYTHEQADSLHNYFNQSFGKTSDGFEDPKDWAEAYDIYNKHYRRF
jgi:hypothetical protein